MIEFDKRITNPKLIFTPSECRNNYILNRLEQIVYCTNSFDDFANLDKCKVGYLAFINRDKYSPYTVVFEDLVGSDNQWYEHYKYIIFKNNTKNLIAKTGNDFNTVIIDEVPNNEQIDPVELLAKVRDLIRFNTVIYDGRRANYKLHCARVLLSIKQIADSVLRLKQ